MVQIACHQEVEAEFLRLMRRAKIRLVVENLEQFALLSDNQVSDEETTEQTNEHLETITATTSQMRGSGEIRCDQRKIH